MNRYLELAREISYQSTAVQQKMASVIVKGGCILSVAVNLNWKHCEARAIKPHRDYRGATIYVMRSNGRCSRPCDACQKLIIKAGIKRAIYISWDNIMVTESFKES
jgi:deoxycytidylate deaminase